MELFNILYIKNIPNAVSCVSCIFKIYTDDLVWLGMITI